MKFLKTTFCSALLLIAANLNADDTAMWSGNGYDNNWSNPSNWLNQKMPEPGQKVAIKDSEHYIVEVNAAQAAAYDLQPRSGTLNINAGGRLITAKTTACETGDFQGKDLDNGSISYINIQGAPGNPAILDINHTFAVRYGHTEINIKNDGQLNLHNGGSGGRLFQFYNNIDDNLIAGFINITGNGVFRNDGNTPIRVEGNSGFFLHDQATFQTNGDYDLSKSDFTFRHYFFVTGSAVDIQMSQLNVSHQNPNSDVRFRFIADDKGISTINVSSLSFNQSSNNAAVEIDASQLTNKSYRLKLFDYDYIADEGTFDSVTILKGNYTVTNANYKGDNGSITVDIERE